MKHPYIKPFIYSRVFLVFWIVLCAVISISLIRSLGKILDANRRLKALENTQQQVEQKNADLARRIEQADTPFAKEKIIRNELGLQLPGEVIVQLPENALSLPNVSSTPTPTVEKQKNASASVPIFRQWLELFFGK